MERLVFLLQPFEDADGLVDAGFQDINLLEAADHSLAAGEVTVVFIVGGRTDKTYFTAFQIRLQHVRGIHRAVAGTSGTHQIMNFIDIDNGVPFLADTFHNHLQPFFEVASELCPCQQASQVEGIDAGMLQAFRHIAAFDAGCQSVGEGSLSDTRFADVERVVLFLAAQYLDGAFQFGFAAYQRVMLVQGIVQAGDVVAPGLLSGVFFLLSVVPVLVVCLIGGNQFLHEFGLFAVQLCLQQVCRP